MFKNLSHTLRIFSLFVLACCTFQLSHAQLNLITSSISSNPNVGTVPSPSYLVGIDANNCPVTAPTANYIAVKLCNPTGNAIYAGNMTYTGATIPGVHLTGGQQTTQFVGLLAAGECRNVYWHLTWPCNPTNADVLFNINYQLNNGNATQNLTYNITKRKLIDANAGGIVTNFNVNNGNVIGTVVTVTAEYSFANFPNTGAVLAWQPISDSLFNSGCFQLIGSNVISTTAPACVPVGFSDMCLVPNGGNGTVCDNMTISVQYAFMATCANTSSTLVPMTYATSGGQLKKRVGTNAGSIVVNQGNAPPPSITKTASKSVLQAGDTVTYTINICNSSPDDTVVVSSITDSLPSRMQFVQINPSSDFLPADCSLMPAANVGMGNVLNFLGNVGPGFYKSFMIPANTCRSLDIDCRYVAPAGSNLFMSQENRAVYHIGNYTSPTATTTIVTATDPQFLALNDINSTTLNTPVSGSVGINDYPVLNGSFTLLNPPANGNIVFANGTYTYTPNPGFLGNDVITYSLCSPDGYCDTATLVISVVPPYSNLGNIMVAENDNATTPLNTAVTVCVLCNDNDPNGNIFNTPTLVQGPANGTAVIQPNGTILYTPNPGFTGQDVIEYSICDNVLPPACATAFVFLTVTSTPVSVNQTYANDDAFATLINTPLAGSVAGNDTDPQGEAVNFSIVGNPAQGVLLFNPDGSFTYTPTPGYTGPDQFTYAKCDNGTPQICDTASVYFNIYKPLQDANIDINQTLMNVSVGGTVATNDNVMDGSVFSVIGSMNNGTLVLNPNGSYTYTPNTGFIGTDMIQYMVCSPAPSNVCDTASLSIIVMPAYEIGINTIIAQNDNGTTPVNTPLTVCLLCNDSDPQGQALGNPVLIGNPMNGTVILNPNGTITYTPAPGFAGEDMLQYVICDNGNPVACDTAEIYIQVSEFPVAVNQTYANDDAYTTLLVTPVSGDLGLNDTDPQGDAVTFTLGMPPANGTLVLNPNGTFTYTANAAFTGPDRFTYIKCDNGTPVICDEATVYLTVLNPNAALPAMLTAFTAQADNCNIVLNWNTAQEINVSHFDIERKNIGASFETIGIMDAAGNSQVSRAYRFTDQRSIQGSAEYRLRIVDIDGQYSYSDTRLVEADCHTGTDIRLYPNPSSFFTTLYIHTNEPVHYTIVVRDAVGKTVYSTALDINNGGRSVQLPVEQLASGIYSVTIHNGTSIEKTLRFQKSK